MLGNVLAILIALAALYLAYAFIKAKLLHKDQWPLKAKQLDL